MKPIEQFIKEEYEKLNHVGKLLKSVNEAGYRLPGKNVAERKYNNDDIRVAILNSNDQELISKFKKNRNKVRKFT
jgi:uncharacterized protein (UPF0297 family)